MTIQLDPFKTHQREMWSAGEYSELSPYIADVGEAVVARAAITPGLGLLDVACGTGNVARPAARAGARVTGLDLTPRLIERGRAKAQSERLDIDWREGDVENLPFADESFDRVTSTFGHMFAPHHQRAADEMARVCRRGGAIVIATWTPDGTVGEVFKASAAFMPPLPPGASPPILWGTEQYVRERFPASAGFEFEHRSNWIEWESLESFAEFFLARFGPMVTARAMLGDRFNELRERVVEIWRRNDEGQGGRLRIPQQYLLSTIRL